MTLEQPADSQNYVPAVPAEEPATLPEELTSLLLFQENFGMQVLRQKIVAAKKEPETFKKLMGEYQDEADRLFLSRPVSPEQREQIYYLLAIHVAHFPQDKDTVGHAYVAIQGLHTLADLQPVTTILRKTADPELSTQVARLADPRPLYRGELTKALLFCHVYKASGKTDAWIEAIEDIHRWANLAQFPAAQDYIAEPSALDGLQRCMEELDAAINTRNFEKVRPLIAEKATYTLPNGQKHRYISSIEEAFKTSWKIIEDETYATKNRFWHAAYDDIAYCTYDFRWDGHINSESVSGEGRGRTILRKQEGTWKVMRTILINLPLESSDQQAPLVHEPLLHEPRLEPGLLRHGH